MKSVKSPSPKRDGGRGVFTFKKIDKVSLQNNVSSFNITRGGCIDDYFLCKELTATSPFRLK